MQEIICPKCGSKAVIFSDKKQCYLCGDCFKEFIVSTKLHKKRIFLSYGHDEYSSFAELIKKDLQEMGHEVWFDLDRLKPGGDWESYIEEGLEWVSEVPGNGCFLLLMTPYSIRRPDGYCLNEISRALSRKLTIIPVMVVSSEPPLSICRIQWLDMRDCISGGDKYDAKLLRLQEAIELEKLDFEGGQARLIQRLRPLPFEADILPHLVRFTGRKWVFDSIDAWLASKDTSRVFWITGLPGSGKTAIAAWLCMNRPEIAAFHLCRHGHSDKSDPKRAVLSIAYQLSSQLPSYQERLNALDLEKIISMENSMSLFDNLIIQPLSGNFPDPERKIIILIDALDEATEGKKNELASFIASEFKNTPEWMKLIITSRDEPEIRHPLQGLTPYILDTSRQENEEDIRSYLDRELIPFTGGKEVPTNIIDTIFSNSEGIFLYIEWVREELEQRRLSLDRLDEFPKGLGGVYFQFFERKFPDSENFKIHIRPVLELMAAAHEPLEVDHIASLLSWSDYDKKEVLDDLGSLFPVTNGHIQSFHKSVMDWLTDSDRAGDYFTSIDLGNRQLAEYGFREYLKGASDMCNYQAVHLPAHLSDSGREDDLKGLLLDYKWLEVKLEASDVDSLIKDYDLLQEDILQKVQGALRLSSHILNRDKTQLSLQLHGRLLPFSETQSFLVKIHGWKGNTWLRPLKGSFTLPGGPLIRTLEGHTGPVTAISVTSDGKRAVSGSDDKTLRVWDLETGYALLKLEGHTDRVTAISVTSDGKRAVSGSDDKTLRVWDLETGDALLKRGHPSWVKAVSVTSDGKRVVSGSSDETLRVWDLKTGYALLKLEGHKGLVTALSVTSDGKRVVSGSSDATLRVWDLETGYALLKLEGHKGWVTALSVTSDGKRVVSGSDDSTLRVWDLETGYALLKLEGHTSSVWAVSVTSDGKRAVSGSDDKTLRVWNLETGDALLKLEGHTGPVRAVSVTSDEKRAVSGSDDKTLRVWNLETGDALLKLDGHTGPVTAISVTSDGKRAVSVSDDNTLRVWNLETGDALLKRGHPSWVTAVSVTSDGKRVVSGSYDYTLRVWDLETGESLLKLEGHTSQVGAVSVTSDGKRAVSGSFDKSLRVWDLETGDALLKLEGHTGLVRAVSVTSDGKRAVSGSDDKTLRVWDLETGDALLKLEGHTGPVRAVSVTSDGKRAFAGSDDKTLRVWDLGTGKTIAVFRGDSSITACAVSPDGVTIVCGESSGRMHFLRLEE